VLEKTYYMLPEDDGVLERAEGTKIEWNAGTKAAYVLSNRA
jgi:nucleosome assembly protein 1-like 1